MKTEKTKLLFQKAVDKIKSLGIVENKNQLFKFLKATKGEIQIGKSDKAGIYLSDTRKAIIMPVIVSPSNLTNIDGMLLTNVY